MTRFVMFETEGGEIHAVNPDQVVEVSRSRSGQFARLVFGAVTGGTHELVVRQSVAETLIMLEGENPALAAVLAALALAGQGDAPKPRNGRPRGAATP